MTHTISNKKLSITDLHQIMYNDVTLELSGDAVNAILKCRQYLDQQFSGDDAPVVYGINTGFGSLCDTHISNDQLEQLQINLLMSHACGTGEKVPVAVVRLMLFLKIQSLSYGHSGVALPTVQRLVDFFNNEVYPVVYEQGSLGASGDLAPLAHLSLPLTGRGEVIYKGTQRDAAGVLEELQWEPIALQSKEGLALINGTQFMLAYGVYLLINSHQLWHWSHYIAALSFDGFNGNASPFDERIHLIRPHEGQLRTASIMNEVLEGSEMATLAGKAVQDPYSFRCVPQVHGATWDTLKFVEKTFMTEVNSVTDNPNIFPESDTIISGGNFHGQPLALALDYLAIAMSEIANISERRTFQLMSGLRGLPAFLVKNPGVNSGMMILQYTAAGIVSQNKQYATPASVDSIVSSNGQEDHVSMGANAATKAYKIIENVKTVLAIEYLAGSQAVEERLPVKTSPFLQQLISVLREEVPSLTQDRVLHDDIMKATAVMSAMILDEAVVY